VDPGQSPSEVAMRKQRARALERALEGLSEVDRTLIWLRHDEKWPFERIREALGAPSVDAVRKRHVRVLVRLREALGADHAPE
jgi:DNA-directed RNA polymerase specialized sigma24 family protein